MAQVPSTIVLKRDRDLEGRRNEIWVRRGLFALLCAVPVPFSSTFPSWITTIGWPSITFRARLERKLR